MIIQKNKPCELKGVTCIASPGSITAVLSQSLDERTLPLKMIGSPPITGNFHGSVYLSGGYQKSDIAYVSMVRPMRWICVYIALYKVVIPF